MMVKIPHCHYKNYPVFPSPKSLLLQHILSPDSCLPAQVSQLVCTTLSSGESGALIGAVGGYGNSFWSKERSNPCHCVPSIDVCQSCDLHQCRTPHSSACTAWE